MSTRLNNMGMQKNWMNVGIGLSAQFILQGGGVRCNKKETGYPASRFLTNY